MNTLKIATWNIAGGHPINSTSEFDYAEEDLEYFSKLINTYNPDILCLQEAHTFAGGSNAQDLANMCNFKYVFNSPTSVSHINPEARLSIATLSKIPFANEKLIYFPNPEMELFFDDGRKAITHEKGLQIVNFENFSVANIHTLPLALFNYKYDDNKDGTIFAKSMDEVLKTSLNEPLVFCGDFNFNNPLKIYKSLQLLKLQDTLPNTLTKPGKDTIYPKSDFIFSSKEFKVLNSKIAETNTDHFFCISELMLI